MTLSGMRFRIDTITRGGSGETMTVLLIAPEGYTGPMPYGNGGIASFSVQGDSFAEYDPGMEFPVDFDPTGARVRLDAARAASTPDTSTGASSTQA